MLPSSKNTSQEKLIVHGVSQIQHKFDNDPEIPNILLDFDNLDFSNGSSNYHLGDINYNENKEANPFDKISKYYGRHKNVFLFISMLRDEEQLKKIIDILNIKCDVPTKNKFIKRMNIYLDRISQGENDAREFLNSNEFFDAFFNGYHTGENRNIHENLNINITKPGHILETSSFFSKTLKQFEEKSEVKRVKIYSNGKRILTIEKNNIQQRNYSFTKLTRCDIEIYWHAKDVSGKDLNCSIVLSVNSGQIDLKMATIEGEPVEAKEIFELAQQNEVIFIKHKNLCEILATKQTSKEEKNMQSPENTLMPCSTLNEEINVGEVSSP